jgi:glycosyltransferase involved in cell wall biosynthesis
MRNVCSFRSKPDLTGRKMSRKGSSSDPLVSVVTPFYNTERYLSECIESVLGQSYEHFEYILVNNCSTDESYQIAEEYARQDDRIQLISNAEFLPQVANYNRALRQISKESKYFKIVQADDWIMRECISRMVEIAEDNPSVGIVSSYYLTEKDVLNVGLPYNKRVFCGKEVCRMQLLGDDFFFGSPSSVLFRSQILGERSPFYSEARLHEDTEACYEILQEWDFGFVHEILTFTRTANESIMSRVRRLDPWCLDRFIVVYRYGRKFLESNEYERALNAAKNVYFRYLARNFVRARNKEFWDYHRKGLATIGYELKSSELARYLILELLDIAFNPMATFGKILRSFSKSGKRG